MIGYKLVDQDGYTRRGETGETLWEVGSTVTPTGTGTGACGPGVLHDYAHPLLAVLLNPIHANIAEPRMLVLEHASAPKTDGLKRWTTRSVRVLREEPLPAVTTLQRVHWAILVARDSIGNRCPTWSAWADRWLSGEDRSWAAAREATAAAREARAAAREARAAQEAAWAAAWAAEASEAAAQEAAAWAAAREAAAVGDPHAFTARLIELAEQAVREEQRISGLVS